MIVCIGNPVYDAIETPRMRTDGRVLSGCAVNAAIALSRLGYRPIVLQGAVGADRRGDLQERMAALEVETVLSASPESGGFHLRYDEAGRRTLRVLGVARALEEEDLMALEGALAAASFVLLGPILQEISPRTIELVRERTAAPILLDPQGLLRRMNGDGVEHFYPRQLDHVLPLVDIVKANEVETLVMTGLDPRTDGPAAVRALHAKGCRVAIATVAEKGSLIYDGQRLYTIPAHATEAIDPTGAGDTYAAGLMLACLRGLGSWQERGCFASGVASITVEHLAAGAPYSWSEAYRRFERLMSEEKKAC